jgi:intein/homing endonuclease
MQDWELGDLHEDLVNDPDILKHGVPKEMDSPMAEEPKVGSPEFLTQYAITDRGYKATTQTIKKLPAGVYACTFDQKVGAYFEPKQLVTDQLIKFPDTKSDMILEEIERFWQLRDKYKEFGLSHKRGILLHGKPGCHAAGTKVLMSDGSVKSVENVVVGDVLLGPDSKPRKVLELCCGEEEMYKISPIKGDSFIVNASHILSLVRSHKAANRYPSVVNTSVSEFLSLSKPSQEAFKLYRPRAVDFSCSPVLPIDPYVFGTWLGDGSSSKSEITTTDPEIESAWAEESKRRGLELKKSRNGGPRSKAFRLYMSCEEAGEGKNSFTNDLRHLGVWGDKGIPELYLKASQEDRLQLLAGLIDTDGTYSTVMWRASEKTRKNTGGKNFTFVQKSKSITDSFVFLARSLGFATNVRVVTKAIKSTGFSGQYFSVSVGGDLDRIPTRLPRKKATQNHPNKDHLRVGIKSVELLGIGKYYGFTLSGDHLYMTGDFVVHHNSGKTTSLIMAAESMVKQGGVVLIADMPGVLKILLRELRLVEADRPMTVIWEDLDAVIKRYGESEVLEILDGESQVNGIVFVATTNYPEDLDARIVNRPSRFDRVEHIDMPNAESRALYLNAKVGTTIAPDGTDLVVATKDMSIAHLRELVAAIWCFGSDAQDVLKRLVDMEKVPHSDRHNNKSKTGFGR